MSLEGREELSGLDALPFLKDKESTRLRGFIYAKRPKKDVVFVVLRQGLETVQCVADKDNKAYGELSCIPLESYIEIVGEVISTPCKIKGCTVQDVEIRVANCNVMSESTALLPFALKDASAPHDLRMRKKGPTVGYNLCLDNRVLDLRMSQSLAIFRMVDGVMFYYREYLRKSGFIEIKTSKLIGSASEGGANLFEVKYFERKAYLAQSPQLYKQMAIIGGMKRVYEIGHVYRAEESNINRYLSEFIGMDLEMEIETSYSEVMHFIYELFVYIFDKLKEEYSKEMEILREYHPFCDIAYGKDPIVLSYTECARLLRENGVDIGENEDFNRGTEKRLGEIVKKVHGVDLFIVCEYPYETRPFYTKRVDGDSPFSCSYDFILRGEEILSGAQRINSYEKLKESVERCGINPETVQGYLDSFKYGAPPHGGCGIGLERVMKALFDFGDIRYFNLFPRDPERLYP